MNDYDRLVASAKERLSNVLSGPMEPARQNGLPKRLFVTLTEAITWIAFGVALDTPDFGFADEHRIGPFADQARLSELLRDAMARFSEKGNGGFLKVQGRYVANYCDHQAAANADTEFLEDSELRDFARYDSLYGGLERGTGLTWEGAPIDRVLNAKGDGWRDVEVCREDLLRHFHPGNNAPSAQPVTTNGPISWNDFGSECIPELQRLKGLALRDEWWTWPEAIAWVGSQDPRNIATLRFWGREWARRGDGDATVAIGAQDYMARQYCNDAKEVEADLIYAIERGAVETSGRADRDARSAPLAKGDWRGGTVIYSDGVAILASAKSKLIAWAFDVAVNRHDLMREFPMAVSNNEASPPSMPNFDAPQADWLELWQGPLQFRATFDQGRFRPGHSLDVINKYGLGRSKDREIYVVRADPDDGAIVIEWRIGLPGVKPPLQAHRMYDAGIIRTHYNLLRNDAASRKRLLRHLPIELRDRAVGAFATAASMRDWLEREFFSAIHAGQCAIWARVGSKVAPFKRIPGDVFEAYTVKTWGNGKLGAAWAELEGEDSLYSIHVAPLNSVSDGSEVAEAAGHVPRMSHEEVVQWCRDWIEQGRGNGMDKAWDVFKMLPARMGLSRDDNFRPAWTEAKTKHPQ